MGKGKIGRVGSVGLNNAPAEHQQIHRDDPASSRPREATSSRAHEPATSNREDRPVQYTLRLAEGEADQLDDLTRALRRRSGRRAMPASDVLRGLVAEAAGDEQLLDRLTGRVTGEATSS